MFNKALIPVVALVAASVAAPAVAQSRGHGPAHQAPRYEQPVRGWQSVSQRKYELDRRIDQGVRMRRLSMREANRLKGELNRLATLERSYMRGGLTLRERQDLDRRYDRLAAQIRWDMIDRNSRSGHRR